jgi:hypothetical protein
MSFDVNQYIQQNQQEDNQAEPQSSGFDVNSYIAQNSPQSQPSTPQDNFQKQLDDVTPSGYINSTANAAVRGLIGEGAYTAAEGARGVLGDVIQHPSDLTDTQKLEQLYNQYKQLSQKQTETDEATHPLASAIGKGVGVGGGLAGLAVGGTEALAGLRALPEAGSVAGAAAKVLPKAIKGAGIGAVGGAALASANSPNNIIGASQQEQQQNLNDALKGAQTGAMLGGVFGAGSGAIDAANPETNSAVIQATKAGQQGQNLIGPAAQDAADQALAQAQDNAKHNIDNIETAKKEATKAAKDQSSIAQTNAEAIQNKQLLNAAQQTQADIEASLGERGNAYQQVNAQNAGKTINQVNSDLANSPEGRDPSSIQPIDAFDDYVDQFYDSLNQLNSKNEPYLQNELQNIVEGPIKTKQVTTYATAPAVPGTVEKLQDQGELAVAQARQQGLAAKYQIVPSQTQDGRQILSLNIVKDTPPGMDTSNQTLSTVSKFAQPGSPETTSPISKLVKTREGGTLDPTYEQLRQLRTNLRQMRNDPTLSAADNSFINDQYNKLSSLMQAKFPGLAAADAGYRAGVQFQQDIGNGLNNIATLARQGQAANSQSSSIADLARQAKFEQNLAAVQKFDPVLAQKIQRNFQQVAQQGQQIQHATDLQNQAVLNNIENQYQQTLKQTQAQDQALLNKAMQQKQLVDKANTVDLMGLLTHPQVSIPKNLQSAGVMAGNIAGQASNTGLQNLGAVQAGGSQIGQSMAPVQQPMDKIKTVLNRLSELDQQNMQQAQAEGRPYQSLFSKVGLNKDEVANYIKNSSQRENTAKQFQNTGTIALNGPKTDSSNTQIGGSAYNAPDQVLTGVAQKLAMNPQTKNLGEALSSALQSNDSVRKNAAIFAIQQNPMAKAYLDPDMNSRLKTEQTPRASAPTGKMKYSF